LKYRNTRHNAGFLALKALEKKHKISIRKKAFQGIYGIGRVSGKEVLFFEPRTYMNLSGDAVKALCSSRLTSQEDLLVISDDFNLAIGRIRMREKGSAGGHNGLQSIINKIGSDFARLRIGVGPADGFNLEEGQVLGDMSGYVLAPFPRKDKAELNKVIEKVVECVEIWLQEGTKKAMNQYNI